LGHNVPISKAEYTAYKGMVDLQVLHILYAFVFAKLMSDKNGMFLPGTQLCNGYTESACSANS